MGRKPTGSPYRKGDAFYAAITVAKGDRQSFPLPTCANDAEAAERTLRLNEVVQSFRTAGHERLVPLWAPQVAACAAGEELDRTLKTAAALCRGEFLPSDVTLAKSTIREIGTRWTSGALAEEYRGQVDARAGGAEIAGVLEKHVYPYVGEIPARSFTEEDGQTVLNHLAGYSPAYVNRIAKLLVRLLNIAVRPLKLITASPLPKGWVPSAGSSKARSCVRPSEDAQLMGCVDVHVDLRMLVGYLHREGDRKGESLALVFDDFDLPAEMVNLDKNKTDDPRSWRLSPGVARALSAYKALREAREGRPLTGKDTVFCIPVGPHGGHSLDAARVYRRSLLAAGVTRAQLHERNANRSPARLHDTRASFVTVAFANGKGDLWISDRTGHTTMTERKRYRRDARAFAESNLGDWRPLDGLIPELAPYLLVAEQAPVEQASVEQATEPALPCVSGVLDCAAGASGAPICDGEEAPTGVRHFPLEAIVEDSVDAASRSTLGATVINVVFQRDLPSRSDAKSFPTLGPPQSPEGTSFV